MPSTLDNVEIPSRPIRGLNALAKTLLCRQLEQLTVDQIVLKDCETTTVFGRESEGALYASLIIRHPDFYGQAVFGGSLGCAESYIQGEWDTDQLVDLIRILVRNRPVLDGLETGLARLATPIRGLLHAMNRNTRSGSRKNIAAHYDLGNALFELFLDPTLMYSCARFEPESLSLEEAQTAKLDGICRRLALQPTDHVIEIGTGWGGFALHAARHYGCRVTTTTISQNQYQRAFERIRDSGLEDRITLIQRDYRDLEGVYDKLVSIEMIEAIGHAYFETFFQVAGRLLKPDGLMLLQAITLNDRHYLRARDEVDFIKKYIFPGSCIPAIGPLLTAATQGSDLQLIHLEDLAPHYALTLRHWRERFLDQQDEVLKLGYSQSFIRLWTFYLAYCEGGYAERALGDIQAVFQKPGYRGPMPPTPDIRQ